MEDKKDSTSVRREVDGKAEIPGKDPFDIVLSGAKLPDRGILVSAQVEKGYGGVVVIYEYGRLTGQDIQDHRPKYDEVILNVGIDPQAGSRVLQLAYENPMYSRKDVEPMNRTSPASYLGRRFKDLDINKLFDGGRLLIEKKAHGFGSTFISFRRSEKELDPDFTNREVARLFESGDFQGASEAVGAIISKLVGTAKSDTALVTSQVRAKLEAKE